MATFFLLCVLACAVHTIYGAKLSLVTDHTLGGQAVAGTPMNMTLTTDDQHLSLNFSAPYELLDEDESANRVHLFLADEAHKITELQFTRSGCVLRMYWAPYNVLRTLPGDEVTCSTTVSTDKKRLTGSAKVHRDWLPPRITLINAASVHPANSSTRELQYDNLYSITNYGIALPDLMVLPRYKALGARFLFDNDAGYSPEWKTTG